MELAQRLDFDHDDRKDLYEYVERHGTVDPEAARRALGMDERQFGHHLAVLRRDGIVEKRDGDLRIAYEDPIEEEFTAGAVQVTIRQARQEDLSGLVGAIRQAIGGKTYVDAETVADVVEGEGVLLRNNDLESRVFFVATVDDEVVGWVHLKHPELEKLAHSAELTVGVLEEYRGQGIGSQLLERGLAWARSQGLERIYNSVPATNEAGIEFLEAHGWEIEAVREAHYKLEGAYIDEIMLARRLD
jgi:ribosomal protein S18 acetylase RimI-like enzyme